MLNINNITQLYRLFINNKTIQYNSPTCSDDTSCSWTLTNEAITDLRIQVEGTTPEVSAVTIRHAVFEPQNGGYGMKGTFVVCAKGEQGMENGRIALHHVGVETRVLLLSAIIPFPVMVDKIVRTLQYWTLGPVKTAQHVQQIGMSCKMLHQMC